MLNYIHWNIDPEIVNVFGISLRYYGVFFVGGLILCLYILNRIFKKENISRGNLEKLSIYGIVGIFAGARLAHFVLLLSFFVMGCAKKNTQVTYRLSVDLCMICDSAHYKVIGNDTIQLENIITPNNDAVNDRFYLMRYGSHEKIDSVNFTVFDRLGKQIVHFDHYLNDWPKYIPSQYQQDLTGLSNGLYKYRITSPSGNTDGVFIIIFRKDEYIDTHIADAKCFNCIRCFDSMDPVISLY